MFEGTGNFQPGQHCRIEIAQFATNVRAKAGGRGCQGPLTGVMFRKKSGDDKTRKLRLGVVAGGSRTLGVLSEVDYEPQGNSVIFKHLSHIPFRKRCGKAAV
jgi:hypothetical protein